MQDFYIDRSTLLNLKFICFYLAKFTFGGMMFIVIISLP